MNYKKDNINQDFLDWWDKSITQIVEEFEEKEREWEQFLKECSTGE